jgi:serpin B
MTGDPVNLNDLLSAPAPEALDPAILIQGNNALAIEFYRRLSQLPGNLIFSPASLSIALAMLYAGARGDTAHEIAQMLQLDSPPDSLPQSLLDFSASLQFASHTDQDLLAVAHALWIQKGQAVLPRFSELLNAGGKSALHPIDFAAPTESARSTINRWVEEHTANKIAELIEPGFLNASTRLVLTVAIYFKKKWDTPFHPRLTMDQEFHVSPGRTLLTPMMHRTDPFRYFMDRTLSVLEIPYQANDFSMILLLPHTPDGLPLLEQSLTPALVDGWLKQLLARPAYRISVTLPIYKAASRLNLIRPLREMGMRQAFERGAADFSGITGHRDIFLDGAVQQACIEVNEQGVEAAAATGMRFSFVSAPPDFRANHPFLFLIRDNRTGAIIFIGRLADPGI